MSYHATTPDNLRVLIVNGSFPPFEYRSLSQGAYDQAIALCDAGVDVTVLTQNNCSRNAVVTQQGLEVHYVGVPTYDVTCWEMKPLVWAWQYLDYIASGALDRDFDIIHVHDLDFALPVRFLAPSSTVPFVSHLHVCFRKRAEIGRAYFNVEMAHYYQFIMTQASAVVATVSQSERECVGELLHCAGKTVVVPNGLNFELFETGNDSRAAVRKKHGVEDSFVILFGGRIGDWMKSPDIVGRAFTRVANARDQAILLLAVVTSTPPENLEYLMKAVDERARSRIRVLYPTDKKELLQLYAAADVFVMPSRYEPFGLMALEAMACGCPVIVAPVGGLDEIVRDGDGGLKICWGGDTAATDDLAAQIFRLMDDADLRRSLASHARAAARRFDVRDTAATLIEIYNRLKTAKKGHSCSWTAKARLLKREFS